MHEREAEEQRGTTTAKGYGTRCQRIRERYLYAHPWCLLCTATATVADHFPLSRRQLFTRGVVNPDAFEHLRPLCSACHNKRTAKHQPDGWAAERVKPRREAKNSRRSCSHFWGTRKGLITRKRVAGGVRVRLRSRCAQWGLRAPGAGRFRPFRADGGSPGPGDAAALAVRASSGQPRAPGVRGTRRGRVLDVKRRNSREAR